MKKQLLLLLIGSLPTFIQGIEDEVKISNISDYPIAKVVIKTILAGSKKGSDEVVTYKGFVEILNLKTGETRSVNMSKTANKATKDNSTKLSKWRVKNPNLPLTASEYITIEKITKYRVRTVQPQKEDKTTFASRWKRTKNDTSDIRSFIIANNEKEEYKTKNNEKVRRLLKIVTA